jgi:NhaP-type Na+/H+ or K+/H+ antiporter
MATPLPILFYLALSALLVSSCPGAARQASPNYRQAREWRSQMFRSLEYWRGIIGAFPASSIASEQLACDASAERYLLEVAGWRGTPASVCDGMSASIVPIAGSVVMAAAPLVLLTELVASVPEGKPHNA